MELKDKLKELRLSHKMTQESVADYLGVTSQTVSKWERGLLSPDIALLPKIAGLYRCSIDSLFSMDAVWGVEHQEEFLKTISMYKRRNDWTGEYDAWMREIETNPDHYENYVKVMLAVVLRKDFTDDKVKRMLSLAERVETCCTDDTLRNEMYRVMVALCAESQEEEIKKKALAYTMVEVSEKTIDEINILEATKLGMKKAIEGLAVQPDVVLTDGNMTMDISFPQKSVVHGDALSYSIGAASIVAKV